MEKITLGAAKKMKTLKERKNMIGTNSFCNLIVQFVFANRAPVLVLT